MPVTNRTVAAGYEEIAALFEAYAAEQEEAQLCVYVGGQLVLDMASNIDPDSVMTVYSVSKSLAALALAKLVDLGRLDLDARVSDYWPEFGAKGKQDITVRQLLSHQAGLPETDTPLLEEQWLHPHAAADALAQQRPLWFPGRAFGYHGLTIGPLMSELCFRITGQTVQEFYEAEIRQLAEADAFLGLPEEHESRVVDLLPGLPPTAEQAEQWQPTKNWHGGPIGKLVFGRGLGDFLLSRRGRAFGLASAAGVASARGLAKVFQWATGYGHADSGISAEVLDQFAQLQSYGLDLVLDQPTRAYGVVFMKPHTMLPFGSHRAFGHDGAGGAMVIADPIGEIVLAYTIRRVPFPGGMDLRLLPIMDALREKATA